MSAVPGEGFDGAAESRRRWCREARTLATLSGPDAPALRPADTVALGRLPDWVAADARGRDELALLCGAVLCATALRRTIDGRVLGPLGQALGAARLSAVTALRVPAGLPANRAWGGDPVVELTALGGEALVRDLDAPPAVRARLARLFPASEALGGVDPHALRRAVDTARMLWQPAGRPTGVAA